MSDNSEDTGSPPPPHMGHPGQPSVQYPPNDVMGQMPMEQRMVSDGHPGGQGLPHQAAFQRPYLDCNNKPPQDVA